MAIFVQIRLRALGSGEQISFWFIFKHRKEKGVNITDLLFKDTGESSKSICEIIPIDIQGSVPIKGNTSHVVV